LPANAFFKKGTPFVSNHSSAHLYFDPPLVAGYDLIHFNTTASRISITFISEHTWRLLQPGPRLRNARGNVADVAGSRNGEVEARFEDPACHAANRTEGAS
jgi:hypothetical protein